MGKLATILTPISNFLFQLKIPLKLLNNTLFKVGLLISNMQIMNVLKTSLLQLSYKKINDFYHLLKLVKIFESAANRYIPTNNITQRKILKGQPELNDNATANEENSKVQTTIHTTQLEKGE